MDAKDLLKAETKSVSSFNIYCNGFQTFLPPSLSDAQKWFIAVLEN